LDLFWIKIALFVTVLTNLSFWLLLFVKLTLFNNNSKDSYGEKSISLVVCIKNGQKFISNIKSYLDSLGAADQLVIVDDFSTDNTENLLQKQNDKRIKILRAKIDQKGKKQALQEGIESAKNEIIFLTDIDCVPRSQNWLNIMSNSFSKTKEIVLGYGAYKKYNGLLNAFIRHETLMTAMQYMSYALAGKPYMGVGRNLAYKKTVFLNSNKFDAHRDLASGDDDLFVSEVSNKFNTTICLQPETFTESEPARTTAEFIRQKSRHITTANRYKVKTKFLLSLYALSHLLSYLLPLILISMGAYKFACIAFFIRLGISWIVYAKVAQKFEEQDLKFWYPLLDIIMIMYYFVLSPFLFIQRKQW